MYIPVCVPAYIHASFHAFKFPTVLPVADSVTAYALPRLGASLGRAWARGLMLEQSPLTGPVRTRARVHCQRPTCCLWRVCDAMVLVIRWPRCLRPFVTQQARTALLTQICWRLLPSNLNMTMASPRNLFCFLTNHNCCTHTWSIL